MSNYDPGAIRRLLLEVFPDEEEFGYFCEDYFPEVPGKFPEGASFRAKSQTLTQHCLQNNLVEKLLALIQKNHPAKYQELSASLLMVEDSGVQGAAPAQPEIRTVAPPSAPSQSETLPEPAAASPADLSSGRPSVFISYRRKDLDFVTQLHQELTHRGISAWFDQENIEVADHWRTSIAEGIVDCKVFILILSPDAVVSVNIRKEVDLAEKYDKRIVPLMWRKTEIPPAFDYALAGIQWIDFKEMASQENFDELADIIKRLVGGASMSEATSQKPIAKESPIPAIQKEAVTAAAPKLGLKKKSAFNPIALQGLVISGVIITFGLDTADQDSLILELQWLFHATDNLLKIRNGEANPNQPIEVDIPPQAQIKDKRANNQILSPSFAPAFANPVEEIFKRIKVNLDNLNRVLEREVQLGEAAIADMGLQAEIRGKRVAVVKELQTLAQLMSQAYGVFITTPGQLIEFLEA